VNGGAIAGATADPARPDGTPEPYRPGACFKRELPFVCEAVALVERRHCWWRLGANGGKGGNGANGGMPSSVHDFIAPIEDMVIRDGVSPSRAPVATALLAQIRGLQFDLAATDGRDRVDDTFSNTLDALLTTNTNSKPDRPRAKSVKRTRNSDNREARSTDG
jgi:hypothetical protein